MRRLGKLPKRTDPRTLKLADYAPPLPAPAAAKDWSPAVSRWRLFENDWLPCCTITALAHAIQCWTANDSAECIVPGGAIIDAFGRLDPTMSRGAYMLDALRLYKRDGVGGHRCLAYAEIDPSDPTQLMHGIEIFGGVYAGLRLPESAQNEDVWHRTDGQPNSWGGHAVWLYGHGTGARRCVTWGAKQVATPEWIARYCDEAYVVVSEAWAGGDNMAPSGFDLERLLQDVERI